MRPGMIVLAVLMLAANANAQCVAPKEWFPHETANLQPDFHAPNSNCGFHQAAWQTFLWLTQAPDPTNNPGRIRLFDMPTADALFMPGKAPPTLSKALTSKMKKQALVLKPRVSQTDASTSFGDIRQAGSKGLLVDKKGRAVYYASHVSPTFYQFVRTNGLFIKDNYVKFPPTSNFPVGSIELKSSWRVVEAGEDASKFYTTPALIHPLVCKTGADNCMGDNVVVDLSQTESVTVALVGLHIVVVLEDHPEALWATFEHDKNAPDLAAGTMPNDPVSQQKDFTFYSANTLAKDCNMPNAMTISLDAKKKQLTPITNVLRQFAFGGGDAQDTKNIQDLNASVKAQLNPASVWQNYFLVGGVWFGVKNGLTPGLNGNSIQANVVGSVRVSNSTMETFTQVTSKNCFACHNTKANLSQGIPAMNLNISHILMNGLIQRHQAHTVSAKTMVTKNSAPLQTFADVQKMLNDFVSANNITPFTHGQFWKTMTYQQFVTGNVPNVSDDSGKPLRVLVPKNSKTSNLIMALRGAKGTIFDPNSGSIGRMPPGGPFMADADIDRLADWIDRGALDGTKDSPK